jgi:uncharacterized protein
MIGTSSANFHQGQRSCVPRKQTGHVSALDQLAATSKKPLAPQGPSTDGTMLRRGATTRHPLGRCSHRNLPQPLFALGGYIGNRNPANSHLPSNCGIIRPMNQAMLIEVLRTYDPALRENGATGLFIFGSRATGVPRSDSDLDLFIDYDPATKVPNIFRLMQIEEDISKALGIPVTITTRNALHPLMKESIERDAIRVS